MLSSYGLASPVSFCQTVEIMNAEKYSQILFHHAIPSGNDPKPTASAIKNTTCALKVQHASFTQALFSILFPT